MIRVNKNFFKYVGLIGLLFPMAVFSASGTIKPEIRSGLGTKIFEAKNLPNIKAFSFTPDGTELWGTSLMNDKNGVFVLDSQTGQKINSIRLPNGGGVEIVFLKDGTKAYISQMENAKVFEIDTQTKEILRTFNTGGNWTKFLALSADEKTLYAANWVSNDISVINLDTGKLVKKIKTVKTPRGIYPTEDGKFLYVAGFGRGELQKINLINGEKKMIYKSGGAMRHVVYDAPEQALFISDMAKAVIYKLDLASDQVTKFMTTDSHPNTIALMDDGKILVVSCRGKNNPESYYIPGPTWGSIQLFDVENGNLLDAIIGGNQPTALAVNGSTVAFSDFLDNKIEAYSFGTYDEIIQESISNTWVKEYKKYLTK